MPVSIVTLWSLPVAAYVVGSLSPAYFAGKIHGIDLREHGSKSLGATNAGRVLGGKWFFIVFIADVLKGWGPAALAKFLAGSEAAATPNEAVFIALATGSAVVLGHIFTCFHRFRGGKAVATSLGVLVALMPLVAGLAFAAWLLAWLIGWGIVRAKKSSSVGPASVLAAIAAPIIHVGVSDQPWAMPELAMTVFIIGLAILIIVKHRSNLARMAGAAAS